MESIYCGTPTQSGIVDAQKKDFVMKPGLKSKIIGGALTIATVFGSVVGNGNQAQAKTPFDNDIEWVTDDPGGKDDPAPKKDADDPQGDIDIKAAELSGKGKVVFIVHKGNELQNVPQKKIDHYMRNTILKDMAEGIDYDILYENNYDVNKTVYSAIAGKTDYWGFMTKGQLQQNIPDINGAGEFHKDPNHKKLNYENYRDEYIKKYLPKDSTPTVSYNIDGN